MASGGGGSWNAEGFQRRHSASGGDGSWARGRLPSGGTASAATARGTRTASRRLRVGRRRLVERAELPRGGTASGSDGSWNAHGADGGYASGGGGSWNAHGADGGYASRRRTWSATGADGGTAVPQQLLRRVATPGVPPADDRQYLLRGRLLRLRWLERGRCGCGGRRRRRRDDRRRERECRASSNAYAQATWRARQTRPTRSVDLHDAAAGCATSPMSSATYYKRGGGVWLSPSYGANGVYYRIIPAP